ncbi:MAG: phenylpyruvate tautomerase MIF-related protein [Eubacterium sp.]
MPFINVKTNVDAQSSKELLKSQLGEAITAIPGKSESWLMVQLEDKLDMWFKGSDEPCIMFEVSIFGNASDNAYDDLTKRICSVAEKTLSISPDRVYVKYAEVEHWGYNNFNF